MTPLMPHLLLLTLTLGAPASQPVNIESLIAEVRHPTREGDPLFRLQAVSDAVPVERLIRALDDNHREVRRWAAEQLGKRRDRRAVKPLIHALGDSCRRVRSAAAWALSEMGDKRAVKPLMAMVLSSYMGGEPQAVAEAVARLDKDGPLPALLAALRDPDWRKRVCATYVLGFLDNRKAVGPLKARLAREKDKDLRRLAAGALIWLGDPAGIRPMAEAVADDPFGVGTGNRGMRNVGRPAVKPLLRLMESSDRYVRIWASQGLRELKDPHAVPGLVELLRRGDEEISAQAFWALAGIPDARAVPALIEAANDPDDRIRSAALFALGQQNDRLAAPVLIAALDDPVEINRQTAANGLCRITDPRAVKALLPALSDPSGHVQYQAFEALLAHYRAGHRQAQAVLVGFVESSQSGRRRHEAAHALADGGWKPVGRAQRLEFLVALQRWQELADLGPDGIDRLVQQVGEAGPPVSTALATTVIKAGPRALNLLVHLVGRKDVDSRGVIEVIGQFGKPAVDPLRKLLKDSPPHLRTCILEALGRTRDPGALGPLLEAARSQHAETVKVAVLGLWKLGDRRALPLLQKIAADPKQALLTRGYAIQAMGATGDPDAWWPLVRIWYGALGVEWITSAELAVDELDRDRATAMAAGALLSPNPRMRRRAVRLLSSKPNRLGRRALRLALYDADPEVRTMAVRSLATHCRDRRVVKPLLALLREEKMEADETVGYLRLLGPDALPTLIEALGPHEPFHVRKVAAEALGELGDRRAVQPLMAWLMDRDFGEEADYGLNLLGWSARNDTEWVYVVVADRDKKDLLSRWPVTRRVLLSEARQADAVAARRAVEVLIGLGKDDVVVDLAGVLQQSDEATLARTLVNCGQAKLRQAAVDWGKRHGVRIAVDPKHATAKWGAWVER